MSTTPFYLQSKVIFGVIAAANLLNYIDRGIIPGSTNELNSFIKSDLDTDTPDVFLGLLQSSFIIGFMFGSIIFSHLIHTYGRFTLTGIGCSIWIVAVMLSGSAYYSGSYVFLLFARILSGLAEASMQCAIPPWIQKTAPAHQKGLWLGIFYMAIPVGLALGYAYSSICSESVGWQFAFFFEGFIMVPFVIYMFLVAPHFPPDKVKVEEEEGAHPTIWQEILIVCGRPVFLCFCMAYAAQSATLTGLSTFGSSFMMGLGYFDKESQASTLFGIVISISGMIATPLGGVLLDKLLANYRTRAVEASVAAAQGRSPSVIEEILDELDEQQLAPLVASETLETPTRDQIYSNRVNKELEIICLYIAALTAVGATLLMLVYFVYDKGLFLFLVGLSTGLIFMTSSAIMMGVMLSVPTATQSFGIAVNNICLHGFGDVPSPVIIGYIKDVLAPGCVAKSDDDGNIAASQDCRDDGEGLRITMLVTTLWLIWVIFFYLLAWVLCQRRFHLFSWGLVAFDPSSSGSNGEYSNPDGANYSANDSAKNTRSSGDSSQTNPLNSVVKEGAGSVMWKGKNINAAEDSVNHSSPSDQLNRITPTKFKSKKDRPLTGVTTSTDDVSGGERSRLLSDHSDHEKENDHSLTRRTNSAENISPDHDRRPKSRVLSNDELSNISKTERKKNIERIKRLSHEVTGDDNTSEDILKLRNSSEGRKSKTASLSLGSAEESSFQKVMQKKGLLQRDSFAHRLKEAEDTIQI
eukprot:gene4503-4827_t